MGDVGAGDLITEYDDWQGKKSIYNDEVNTLLTNIFNKVTNGSLPLSIFKYTRFFTKFHKQQMTDDGFLTQAFFELTPTISPLSMKMYGYFWTKYNDQRENLTIYCPKEISDKKINCSDPKQFILAKDADFKDPYDLEEYPECKNTSCVYFAKLEGPPCSNLTQALLFHFLPVCDFISNVSVSKSSFYKMMKFSIQAPVLKESLNEEFSTFANISGWSY